MITMVVKVEKSNIRSLYSCGVVVVIGLISSCVLAYDGTCACDVLRASRYSIARNDNSQCNASIATVPSGCVSSSADSSALTCGCDELTSPSPGDSLQYTFSSVGGEYKCYIFPAENMYSYGVAVISRTGSTTAVIDSCGSSNPVLVYDENVTHTCSAGQSMKVSFHTYEGDLGLSWEVSSSVKSSSSSNNDGSFINSGGSNNDEGFSSTSSSITNPLVSSSRSSRGFDSYDKFFY